MTKVDGYEQSSLGGVELFSRDLLRGLQVQTVVSVEFQDRRLYKGRTGAFTRTGVAMNISRRKALVAGMATAGLSQLSWPGQTGYSGTASQTVYSITPVGFDQVWIWEDQPEDAKGPVDGREFEVSVGVRWKSDGNVRNVMSSTVAPVAFPEQELIDFEIQKSDGCEARVVPLSESAGQLQVVAPAMERGQEIEARAVYRMKISRFCPHYEAAQFPAEQKVPEAIKKAYLGNSPGIRCDLTAVKRVVESVISRHEHPWDTARKFHTWVWENIQGKPGVYTSVREALANGVGDCEERAGVFIALCRAVGIPARLVWVPNHSWAEFCLFDEAGQPHWIPSHTAAYNWFGWTGAHELILQKGDRIRMPGQGSVVRLIMDWYSFDGRRPAIEFFGHVNPVSANGKDAGPGKRKKNEKGGWDLVCDHPDKHRIRGL